MSKLKETVFVGRDNGIRLSLYEDGIALMTAYPDLVPTRWLLTIHSTTPIEFDSDTDSVFSWDSENSIVEISIGSSLTTSDATASVPVTLRLFADIFSNGIVLLHPTCTPDKLYITICSEG